MSLTTLEGLLPFGAEGKAFPYPEGHNYFV